MMNDFRVYFEMFDKCSNRIQFIQWPHIHNNPIDKKHLHGILSGTVRWLAVNVHRTITSR